MPINGAFNSSLFTGSPTYSTGDRNVTYAGGGGGGDTIGTDTKDHALGGKWYWELTIAAPVSAFHGCQQRTYPGAWTSGIGFAINETGAMFVQGGGAGTGQTWGAGDVLGFAADFPHGKWWYRVNAGLWNNSATDNPATNTGGVSDAFAGTGEPMELYVGFNNVGGNVTLNTGTLTFANAAPSGFLAWYAPAAATSDIEFNQPWSSIGNQNIMVGA